ncbi:unnamed protein product [Sphagnum balticum]
MPEGPWIKRNNHGVVFTEEVLPSDGSLSFEDTARPSESKEESAEEGSSREEEEKKTLSKKEEFLRRLRFDE